MTDLARRDREIIERAQEGEKYREIAEDFLDSSPSDCKSRVVPMEEYPAQAVEVEGVRYTYESRDEFEAAAL